MTRARWSLWLTACLVASASILLAGAQTEKLSDTMPAGKNPHLANKGSIKSGMTLYRVRCGDCHGLDASGYRGPDLNAAMNAGMNDERMFSIIRKGVPGTEMPPSGAPDDEVLMIMAYLRNLGGAAAAEKPIGNVDNGQKLFQSQCASCHRVGDRGGRLGPDLSRIGAARSRAALEREIRTPSEWMAPGFETITLVLKDGRKVSGTKKNEDVVSVQVMDTRERIQGYLRSSLQDVIYEKTSLMPAYGAERLNAGDLNDLLGYLSTLRAAAPGGR